MKRYGMETYRLAQPDQYEAMCVRDDGEYVLYSDANAIIGDLRRRLEIANETVARAERAGYDPRYPYSERLR